MSFSINCPHCGTRLKAKEKLIGRKIACPKCGTEFRVSAPEKSNGPPPEVAKAAGPGAVRSRKKKPAPQSDARKNEVSPVRAVSSSLPPSAENEQRRKVLFGIGVSAAALIICSIAFFIARDAANSRLPENVADQQTSPHQADAQNPQSNETGTVFGQAQTTGRSQPQWIRFQPDKSSVEFTVEMPAEPVKSSITVNNTSWKHYIWTLNQGSILYSIRPFHHSGSPDSKVRFEQKVELANRKGRSTGRKVRSLPLAVSEDYYFCSVQSFTMPQWRKFTSVFVDRRGYLVQAMYEQPPAGQQLPSAVAFQFVYAEHDGGVALQVEVDEQYYQSSQADVDSRVERFFSSFDRPELRKEAIEQRTRDLAERIPALLKILEAGESQRSYEEILLPRDVQLTMDGTDPKGEVAKFQEKTVPRLIALFRDLNPDAAAVIGYSAVIQHDGRQVKFRYVDGQWYVENALIL